MGAYRAALSLSVIILCSTGQLAAAKRINSAVRAVRGPDEKAEAGETGCKKEIMALSGATMMRIANFFGPDCGIKQEHMDKDGGILDAGMQAMCGNSCQNNVAFATRAPNWKSVQAKCQDRASLQLLQRAGQSIAIHATLQAAWTSCPQAEQEDVTPEVEVLEDNDLAPEVEVDDETVPADPEPTDVQEVVPPIAKPARVPIAKPTVSRIKQTILAIDLNNALQNAFNSVDCAKLKKVWRKFDWNADGKLTRAGVADMLDLVDTTEILKNLDSMQTDERTQNPDYITFLDLAEQRLGVREQFDCMLEWAQGA